MWFKKIEIPPIHFSTINSKDFIKYEVHTPAPEQMNAPQGALIRWKVKNLPNRKYQFIIGNDLLNKLNSIIDLEEGSITFNENKIKLLNNPYLANEICTLEPVDNIIMNHLDLEHLNQEEYREIENLVKRFSKIFFKEGDKLTSTPEIKHEIVTTTNQQINAKLYRYPPKHEEEVRKQIKEMEEQGIIRKSNSK